MKLLLILSLSLFLSYAQERLHTKQLLVVTAQNWSASEGVLQRFEREGKRWHKVGKEIYVKLGREGLGWGRGLHTIPKDAKYIKKEGDGKAPAGIFRLKQAFGYAPFKMEYPYRVYKESDHCVDDTGSKFYNKIVNSMQIERDYQSYEKMHSSKVYYKYGIVVDHNGIGEGEKSIRGAGSCIFIHIKSVPTAGCTAMRESEIKEIMRWLDADAEPLLIQGTKKDMQDLMKQVITIWK